MPADQPFISYAQNSEDVVLWRALGQVQNGRYVDVGANHPTDASISRAFYDRGWTGVAIEPVPEFVEAFRTERPKDVVVQAAVTDADIDSVTMHVIDGTGLSTLDDHIAEEHRHRGWTTRDETVPARRLDDVLEEHVKPGDDIHFMVVDCEGSERSVLSSVDLRRWRPWVLVVEATAPNTSQPTHEQWEPLVLRADYEFCLFDGLSRFYVAKEHADALRPALSAPSNPLDDFIPYSAHRREQDVETLRNRFEQERARCEQERARSEQALEELVRWRGAVLARWVSAASGGGGLDGRPGHEIVRLREELAATRATVSWRVTAPLRALQERRLRGHR